MSGHPSGESCAVKIGLCIGWSASVSGCESGPQVRKKGVGQRTRG